MKRIYLYVALVCMIAISCTKEASSDDSNTAGTFSISILTKSIDSTQSSYFAVFSLKRFNGDTIIRDSMVRITKAAGSYVSDPLTLDPGMYDLTKLLVYNGFNDCVYGTPVTSTAADKLLNIPFGFQVQSGFNTLVGPTLKTAGAVPEAIGYTSFAYPFKDNFMFQVVAWDTWKPAGIVYAAVNFTVSTGSYTYRKNIGSDITNIVLPNDTCSVYTLRFLGTISTTNTVIAANAHDTVSITYPKDSLLNHAQTPFVIFVRKKPS